MTRVRVTEYLEIDLAKDMWCCNRCKAELISAKEPYLRGCLVHERPGAEVYGRPIEVGEGQVVTYAPDPAFLAILEFYCPGCGAMVEVQYLPPGHPIPVDIELDLAQLREKHMGSPK
jgi:acetone carboxylase, gamma subunit